MAQFMEKPRTATHFRLGTRLAGYAVSQRKKKVIWFVWFVSFVWLNQTNQIAQTNQRNQMNQTG